MDEYRCASSYHMVGVCNGRREVVSGGVTLAASKDAYYLGPSTVRGQ